MKKFYDIEIDSQVELENGKILGKLEESKISVNDGNCGSGGWPADLPKPSVGGYGYTEQGDQTVITWDGDTTGKTVVADAYCKVADSYFNNEDIVGMNITLSTGQSITVTQEMYDGMIEYGQITEDFAFLGDEGEVVCVRKPNIDVFDYHFDEIGIYFSYADGLGHTSSLTYGTPDTVHKIDEKYLPSGVVFWLKQDASEHDDGYIRMYHDKECTRIVEIAEFNALLETRPLIWLRQPTGSNEAKLGVGYMPGVIDEGYAGAVRKYNGEVVWTAGEAD